MRISDLILFFMLFIAFAVSGCGSNSELSSEDVEAIKQLNDRLQSAELNSQDKANRQSAQTQLANFKSAMDMYKIDNREYPDKLELLVSNSESANWGGPYIDELPTDPWGNSYMIDGDFIKSAGPDQEFSTIDDVELRFNGKAGENEDSFDLDLG